MLLRYDFKVGKTDIEDPSFEGRKVVSQEFELQYKSREPEIDLMNLSYA